MDDQPTCGKGLAEHAPLPAKLGELTAALAENLELHLKMLDGADEHTRNERDVYLRLARQHRAIAADLQATAALMAAQRELPMGEHNMEVAADPRFLEAFQAFVERERELLALLTKRLAQDEQMLDSMRNPEAP